MFMAEQNSAVYSGGETKIVCIDNQPSQGASVAGNDSHP
jgi:hypothetical protein